MDKQKIIAEIKSDYDKLVTEFALIGLKYNKGQLDREEYRAEKRRVEFAKGVYVRNYELAEAA